MLALVAVDVYAAPAAILSGVPSPSPKAKIASSTAGSSCGCEAKTPTGPTDSRGVRDAVFSAMAPALAKCPAPGTCLEEMGNITACLQYTTNKCVMYTHPIKIWKCPGKTSYTCKGAWANMDPEVPCGTTGCPAHLPDGCPAPIPGYVLCGP